MVIRNHADGVMEIYLGGGWRAADLLLQRGLDRDEPRGEQPVNALGTQCVDVTRPSICHRSGTPYHSSSGR